jgi:DNA polymerase elongation subunit (family B)
MNNDLIYGKNPLEKIVGIDTTNDKIFIYTSEGKTIRMPNTHYILMNKYDSKMDPGRLTGDNHYKYFAKFKNKSSLYDYKMECKRKGIDTWYAYNPVEAAMIKDGYTMFKGLTMSDVTVLSFDIETTGVKIDTNSFTTLISNTFRDRDGNVFRKLFDFSSYDKPGDMLKDWCKWVRELNPDIVLGHNIFGFDLPYLSQCANNCDVKLHLGRDASTLKADRYTRRFRKDGSQTYEYTNYRIFGRELIDTFFLSIKYDTGRKYPNYGLKGIIAFEGLEKEGRQHWDFSVNKEPWNNSADWIKFCKYAEEDADDALALYDLMAPQFFYYCQSMPVPFQEIINTATGSQVNKFMLRSYLQQSEAVPKASDKADFDGAISFGNPGVYHNVYKVDVASLYPSIMMEYNIYDVDKDPNRNFLAAVEYFTKERLSNKAKSSQARYYKDLSDGQKIMINSFYGFMGAPGLHFNYPKGAAEVTRRGREILNSAVGWAERKGHTIVNADTDSISFVPSCEITMGDCLQEINDLCPEGIKWENDGIFDAVIVVKAKNYLLKRGDNVTIKGSALKATMKETALKEFLEQGLNLLIEKNFEGLEEMYMDYVDRIKYLKDITPWAFKKTVTESVLKQTTPAQVKVFNAIQGEHYQEGDKFRMFYKSDDELCLVDKFDGEFQASRLYEKLFKTVSIFAPILQAHYGNDERIVKTTGDVKLTPRWKSVYKNFKLKGNQKLLESL